MLVRVSEGEGLGKMRGKGGGWRRKGPVSKGGK